MGMTRQLKKYFVETHAGKPLVFGPGDDIACCMGSRCDFYIYVSHLGQSYYSAWTKGKEGAAFWDSCLAINGTPALFTKLINKHRGWTE